MKWSPQQDRALVEVSRWLKDPSGKQVFRLMGYAGTGKTTLAKEIAKMVDGTVVFGSFTGKAASVMRRKGCIGASTIHSLIYRVCEDNEPKDPQRGNWKRQDNPRVANTKLVIIDEVSMVDGKIGLDLLSYGTRVLALGDPFQLPPPAGGGFFTANEPDAMLDEVHRQSAESPVLRIATDIREGRKLQYGSYGSSAIILKSQVDRQAVLDADQIIVGRNATRKAYNTRLRYLNNRAGLPVPGDRVISLKNGGLLFNGQQFAVLAVRKEARGYLRLDLQIEGSKRIIENVKTHESFFIGDPFKDMKKGALTDLELAEFDFGYAITCHKSQGSQWDNVYVFDESWCFGDNRARWLYTAVTRAAETVTVCK